MKLTHQYPLTEGLSISRVITGLWQIADMEREGRKLDSQKLAVSMKNYVDAGLTTFDMADHYGSAEDISGVYHEQFGNKFPAQFFTKWVPEPGAITKDRVRIAVNKSRKRLKTDAIDVMQFHAWNYADPSWLDALYFLQELKSEGIIKHIGVTNFDTAHLRIAVKSGIEIISNQVCFSLIDQRAAAGMTKLCAETGVRLLAFGTLAGGFLSDRWIGKTEPAIDNTFTWSQMKYKRFIDEAGGWATYQQLLRSLEQIAIKKHVSIANVATRYIMEQPAVAAVIIGARLGESEHVMETLQLFSLDLSDDEKATINLAQQELLRIPGDCGDEYRKPPFLTASGDLSHHVENFPSPYPVVQHNNRTKVVSGTVWEDLAGYARAVRKGNHISISGTTATHGNLVIGSTDAAAQAHFVIDKLEGALQSLGSKLEDVVRTRIFVRNIHDWEPVARAHGERFKNIQPANTLVKAELVGEEYLVEIEADAIVDEY